MAPHAGCGGERALSAEPARATAATAARAARAPGRNALVDALKAGAALCIVAHHGVVYGPVAQQAHAQAPALAAWLDRYGRFAVQIFLVVGGFLAVQSLMQSRLGLAEQAVDRHRRLALPLLAVVLLTLMVCALVGPHLPDELPSDQSPGGLLTLIAAHALLLFGVLGMESLSAGVWYVAIDWQLFMLLALLVRGQALGVPLAIGLTLLCAASAWVFNRWDGSADAWAPYFFAAYGLGALAALPDRRARWCFLVTVAAVALSLMHEFRGRLALALGVAVLLWAWTHRSPGQGRDSGLAAAGGPVIWLAERSYALFLVHYPCLLLVNALAVQAGGMDAGLGLGLVLGLSLLAAQLFHRGVERPLARWRPNRRGSAAAGFAAVVAVLLGGVSSV